MSVENTNTQFNLLDLYKHIETIKDSIKDESVKLTLNGVLTLDPRDMFYINLETPTFDITDNIEEVLWRINGSDNIETLPQNSFIRKYAITEKTKYDLLDKINKDLNNPESEIYKKAAGELGLETLVGKVSPLYGYTRNIPRTRTSSMFYHNLPLAYDKEEKLYSALSNDESYIHLDEKEKQEYANKIIHENNDLFHDQLATIFFALQNKILLDNMSQLVLHCVDPTTRALITDGEILYTRNIFNNSNPFPLCLDSLQFVIINDKVNIKMNFNSFDLFNLFDVAYGMVLLLIADHVLGINNPGVLYISSPIYHIKKEYLDFARTFKIDNLNRFKINFKPGPSFKDFSTTKPHQYIVSNF
jgi:hypothetical protein